MPLIPCDRADSVRRMGKWRSMTLVMGFYFNSFKADPDSACKSYLIPACDIMLSETVYGATVQNSGVCKVQKARFWGRGSLGTVITLGVELTYRQLAVNAEENNRYEQAADLRYLAMEVARKMRWKKVDLFRLSWWYWLLSGYGERVRRAFGVLLVVWLPFALIYWKAVDESWWQLKQPSSILSVKADATIATPIKLTARDALLYSAGVMALQKPEPAPANKRAKLLVLMETIFGPLQAALLALAIRRKFMR